MEALTLAPKTELLTQNKDAEAVFFLTQGAVKILINGEMVAQVDTVQCFGEMSCLIPGTPASATVVTAKESQVFKVPKADFLEVVDRIPKLWKTLFLQMNGRFKSVNMRLSEVLEHTPQGLIKVDKKGVITNEYSIQCTSYFGKDNLAGIPFAQLIHPGKPDQHDLWAQTYPMLFDDSGTLSFQDIADLLDKEVAYKLEDGSVKEFVFSYYPCRNLSGATEAIDIGIEDVTEAREMARKNEQMLAEQASMGKIYENPESFLNLKKFIVQTLATCLGYLKQLQAGAVDVESDATKDCLRKLHSLKGYAGVFALKPVQSATHHLEELIKTAQMAGSITPEVMKELAEGLIILKEQHAYADEMFNRIGESLRKRLLGVAFTQAEFLRLKEAADQGQIEEIQKLTRVVEKIDSLKLVANWAEEAAKIGSSLGKEALVTIEGEGGLLPKRVFEDLDRVLVHLLRNSVDHGLEPTEEREEAGKPAQGSIRVLVDVEDEQLQLEIQDDGRGINFEQLADLAACNDKLDQSLVEKYVGAGEAWRILFMPGFSTAAEVTEVSGRGIGLGAVKTVVDSLGGNIQVDSTLGQGTTFRVKIPLKDG
jgi:two-component system chemotaxis sensor kinase CheA